jgi:hypothetical protein
MFAAIAWIERNIDGLGFISPSLNIAGRIR